MRKHKLELAAPLMRAYWTPGLARRLKVQERLRLTCVAEGRLDLLLDILRFLKDKKKPKAVRKGLRGRLHLTYPHFGEDAGLPDAAYELTVPERIGGGKPVVPEPQTPTVFVRRLRRKARRTAGALRTALHVPRRA